MSWFDSTRLKGRLAEQRAARYLRVRGFRIVTRNFSCKTGEIDIIARDGATLVFVEVKSAGSPAYGDPLARVTPAKQNKIINTARYYIQLNKLENLPMRFDVIGIDPEGKVSHIKDAFSAR